MAGGSRRPELTRPRYARAFTLIELIATIAIIAILAAVGLPRFATDAPFAARGYTDEIASALRHARTVAIASSCDVEVTINAAGYRALQRAAAAGTCAAAGGFVMNVRRGDGANLEGRPPANANVNANRVFVFTGQTGTLVGAAPPAFLIGPFSITVDAGGTVQVQ
jgi:MSHA pilin protein MshC